MELCLNCNGFKATEDSEIIAGAICTCGKTNEERVCVPSASPCYTEGGAMIKEQFITERTRIISEMLDNPDKYDIYPTTKCFEELDNLYDRITEATNGRTAGKKYPAHGEYGGPATCAVLKYEDGTEIVITTKELEDAGILSRADV